MAADSFTYTACAVPNVKGDTLKKSRKRFRAAGCKFKAKGPKSGHVKKQTPKAGTLLDPGSKVQIKLG